ncbi:hypothetical protein [Arenimonas sp. MALMAid1274]|uniref:hypothetical protein n=1 Tax=Arenimonas sp. MALMAid1274 TaxID=3411630 RepID=UPI003BA206EB
MTRLLLLFALLVPATLSARDFQSEAETRAFCDKVMTQVATGDLKGEFDLIKEAWLMNSFNFSDSVLDEL